MCSPSPGSGVGRGVICRAAPGGATATAGLFAAAALPELGPELGPELVLVLVAAERAAGLAGLGLRSSRSAPGCVRACAPVAAVAATTRVNRVLAGIGMTTRQLAPCLSSGRANQHARLSQLQQGANGAAMATGERRARGFPRRQNDFVTRKLYFSLHSGCKRLSSERTADKQPRGAGLRRSCGPLAIG